MMMGIIKLKIDKRNAFVVYVVVNNIEKYRSKKMVGIGNQVS